MANEYNPYTPETNYGGSIPGNLGGECYGLYGLPFVECANYKLILDKDEQITGIYRSFILPRAVETQTTENYETLQSLVRSVYGLMFDIAEAGTPLIDSIIAHNSSLDPYWITNTGERIDQYDDRFYDYSLDHEGWVFRGSPDGLTDRIIQNNLNLAFIFLRSAVRVSSGAELQEVDLTGEKYSSLTCRGGGPVKTFIVSGQQTSAELSFAQAVESYGPDARARAIDNIPSREGGNVPSGYLTPDYSEQYTFFNMCLQYPECIKKYKEDYPLAYAYDLGNLSFEQLEVLNPFQASTVLVDELGALNSISELDRALGYFSTALARVTSNDYYTNTFAGRINPEALRRVAIIILAITNSITLLKESLNGLRLSEDVLALIAERQAILQAQMEEYERLKSIEEQYTTLFEATQKEKLVLCNPMQDPIIPNPCTNRDNNGFKTFLDDWRKKDRREPYHDSNKRKYYISYDVIEENLKQLTTNADSYKLDAYRILNEKFSLQLPEDPSEVGIDQNVFVTTEDIYIEPRRFRPSKILYSLDENEVNTISQIATAPRFTDTGIIQEGNYVKIQIFTIEEFFRYLQIFENILKRYTFDHALWKITFGESYQNLNPSILSDNIFEQLKTDKIKQDLKIFKLVRPVFTKLMSKNSIEVLEDLSLKKEGQYGIEDKITLVYSFTPADPTKLPETIEGSSIIRGAKQVKNPQPKSSPSPPTTNNSVLGTKIIPGNNIKLLRMQLATTSRPPTNLVWKSGSGIGDLTALELEEPFKNPTILNYLMNLDTIIQYLRPEEI